MFHSYLSRKHKSKNGRKMNYLNINKQEKEGLTSLCKRIDNKKLAVIPIDKSGRFAVLAYAQYIKAGNSHTHIMIKTMRRTILRNIRRRSKTR